MSKGKNREGKDAIVPKWLCGLQIEEGKNEQIRKRDTWPLEVYEDDLSAQLSNEAEQNWFGYNDGRLLTVPSKEYIRRYIEHCKEIGIRYNILFVKSPCKKIITGEFPKRTEKLGYDLTAGKFGRFVGRDG